MTGLWRFSLLQWINSRDGGSFRSFTDALEPAAVSVPQVHHHWASAVIDSQFDGVVER